MADPRARWLAPVFVAALLLVALWATLGPGAAASAAPSTAGRIAVVILYLVTVGALALNLLGRLTIVAIGAFAAVALGIVFGFYLPPDATAYLGGKLDTLVLLAGVGAVTALVEESGWFDHVAGRILAAAGDDPRKLFLYLCGGTYVLSMFVNNLACILVVIPVSLRVADELEIDPVPLVLAEVIASNLGGASTMIGDFPNMLIASETGLSFQSFLIYLAPIAALQLGLLLWLAAPPRRGEARRTRSSSASRHVGRAYHPTLARGGLALLVAMIVAFLLGGWFALSPAVVAGTGGACALLIGARRIRPLIANMRLDDMAFFVCLFVLVGAVGASGSLDGVGGALGRLAQRSPVLGVLALTWGAALLTCLLNAGPTTALLMHVLATGLTGGAGAADPVWWWALSLGVCAGSSATLTGATAGPVAASLLERHGRRLSFSRFARTGIPFMLLFLAVSTIYLALLVALR